MERLDKLSSTIVNYSIKVKENDRVLITMESLEAKPLVKRLIKDITKNKGIPFVKIVDEEINSLVLETMLDNRLDSIKAQKEYEVNNFDCFIMIRCTSNEFEGKNIQKEKLSKIGKVSKEYNDIRINDRRWVLLNYPNMLDAYKAKMTTDEFFNFALDVMTVDYEKMSDAIKPLKELIERTDKVRIIGPNTDITFSIKGMNAIPCIGEMNLPDGEIYTVPVRDSVNGVITYNTPSPYEGSIFNNVSLTFKDGKIIDAKCSEDNKALNEIFDIDEGARYIGEFAFGFNSKITKPMGDILYDEKINGSIHFTPGQCYRDCSNGNDSSIHWDMVLIQTEEYGGGEIYFDDILIRKNGKFVLPELEQLNN